MLGAIAGDIVGSIYEAAPIKRKDFVLFGPGCRFTDDTVLSVAVADCLLNDGDFAGSLRAYARAHPRRGYGAMFLRWALSDDMPAYGSWGNGAAMRVSPVGFAARDERQALELAARSAAVSHDHPDAVAGAQAVALAIFLARRGRDGQAIRSEIAGRFGYDLSEGVAEIRARYRFDVSCAGTVPPAVVSAVEAVDVEDALRNAVSLGGDSDTLACIAGGLAEALHGLPQAMADTARSYLSPDLEAVVDRFYARFMAPPAP